MCHGRPRPWVTEGHAGVVVAPTRPRARIYSTIGQLQIDTRNLLARNIVTTEELPPLASPNPVVALYQRAHDMLKRIYDGLMGIRPLARLESYFEAGVSGRVYEEVNRALMGENGSSVRARHLRARCCRNRVQDQPLGLKKLKGKIRVCACP